MTKMLHLMILKIADFCSQTYCDLNNSAIIVPQIHWWVFVPKRPSWSPDWCHGNIACFLGSLLSSLLFLCPSMFLRDKLPWGLNAVKNYQPNPRNSQGWWMPFQQYRALSTAINFCSSHNYTRIGLGIFNFRKTSFIWDEISLLSKSTN